MQKSQVRPGSGCGSKCLHARVGLSRVWGLSVPGSRRPRSFPPSVTALDRSFIEGEEGAAEVSREEATAHAQGVSGVPAFVADGRELFSGAQRAELIASRLCAAAGGSF